MKPPFFSSPLIKIAHILTQFHCFVQRECLLLHKYSYIAFPLGMLSPHFGVKKAFSLCFDTVLPKIATDDIVTICR